MQSPYHINVRISEAALKAIDDSQMTKHTIHLALLNLDNSAWIIKSFFVTIVWKIQCKNVSFKSTFPSQCSHCTCPLIFYYYFSTKINKLSTLDWHTHKIFLIELLAKTHASLSHNGILYFGEHFTYPNKKRPSFPFSWYITRGRMIQSARTPSVWKKEGGGEGRKVILLTSVVHRVSERREVCVSIPEHCWIIHQLSESLKWITLCGVLMYMLVKNKLNFWKLLIYHSVACERYISIKFTVCQVFCWVSSQVFVHVTKHLKFLANQVTFKCSPDLEQD